MLGSWRGSGFLHCPPPLICATSLQMCHDGGGTGIEHGEKEHRVCMEGHSKALFCDMLSGYLLERIIHGAQYGRYLSQVI